MGPAQLVLLIYAVLMILGGLMGTRAGSKASLYAGLGSGLALLATPQLFPVMVETQLLIRLCVHLDDTLSVSIAARNTSRSTSWNL